MILKIIFAICWLLLSFIFIFVSITIYEGKELTTSGKILCPLFSILLIILLFIMDF